MPITHAKVSGKPANADPSIVDSDDWNAAHTGSGLPSQWTDGGSGDVTATVDDPTKAPFTIDTSADDDFTDALIVRVPRSADLTGNGYVIRVVDEDGLILWDLDAWGSWGIFGNALGGNVGGLQIVSPTSVNAFTARTDGLVNVGDGSTQGFSVDPALPGITLVNGKPRFQNNAALPADADLAPSTFILWLDDTNGASKLMIKGKSADGTVVTATVPLT